ncbi:MAG: Tic22 family protein [Cyanophyceae cyanobacterium]
MGGALLLSPVILELGIIPLPAVAIPEEDVIEKLSAIPVYTIVGDEGQPLFGSFNDVDSSSIPAFIDQENADTFVERDELFPDDNNPRVIPVPLGQLYEFQQTQGSDPENQNAAFTLGMVPDTEQVTQAISLLQEQGEEVEEFRGVPVFITILEVEGQEVYLALERADRRGVLVFFDYQDFENLVQNLTANAEEPKPKISAQVASLELMIDILLARDDAWLLEVEFVPTPESRQFIQQLREQQSQDQ